MNYPIKTLSQLPLVLKAFRKQRGLTQAALAEKLGVTQQSYAAFEANPAAASLERLFTVLRLLDVDISLAKSGSALDTLSEPDVQPYGQASPAAAVPRKVATPKAAGKPANQQTAPAMPPKKRESW
ncbi:MAG: helix-turn-helix transcriptional regulator [Azonexus sp.]|nr:helix-turn-helix transcriptional regulator [Azonexus sp.]MBP6906021.1 helix-turn-helix transcriptional regulator [Azonexus sp.]